MTKLTGLMTLLGLVVLWGPGSAAGFSATELSAIFGACRTIGLLARPDGPGKISPKDIGTDAGVAPLFGIGNTNPFRPLAGTVGDDNINVRHRGIVTFAGGQPVYQCAAPHHLLGAVGVSGDGVDEDDTVAKGAITAAGFCLTP